MDFDVRTFVPDGTPNADLNERAQILWRTTEQADQWGLGHVLTELSSAARNQDPDARRQLQSNINEMAQGYAVLFYFSIWDHCFDEAERLVILDHWMTAAEAEYFRALKHIRHSLAHSFDGQRARQNRGHFDRIMADPARVFVGVRYTSDTIDLSEAQVAFECRRFFQQLGRDLVARLANNNPVNPIPA